MTDRSSSALCFSGLLLFALGLAVGFGVPAFHAPQAGVAAHLAAMQTGVALMAMGLLWPRLPLWKGWSLPLAHVIWISLYLVCLGLVLRSAWGSGKAQPIGGHVAALWQTRAAALPIVVGSLACLAAISLVLVQWRGRTEK
jgi:(hydroxyamino)benzene mutase